MRQVSTKKSADRGFLSPRRIRLTNRVVATFSIVLILILILGYLQTSRSEIRKELRGMAIHDMEATIRHVQSVLSGVRHVLQNMEENLPSGGAGEGTSRGSGLVSPEIFGFTFLGYRDQWGTVVLPEEERSRVLAALDRWGGRRGGQDIFLNQNHGMRGAEVVFHREVQSAAGPPRSFFLALPLDLLQEEPLGLSPATFPKALAVQDWRSLIWSQVPQESGPELDRIWRSHLGSLEAVRPAVVSTDGPEGFQTVVQAIPFLGSTLLVAVGIPESLYQSRFRELILTFLPLPLLGLGIILSTALFIAWLNQRGIRLEEGLKTMEARQEYQNLMESIYNGILVLEEEDGTISFANEAALKLVGRPRAEVEGKSIYGFIDAGYCVLQTDQHLKEVEYLELSFLGQDGKTRHAEGVSRSFTQEGHAKQMMILADVTDREVYLERKRLLERLATVGQMAAKISHEINNPLFAISAFADQGIRKSADPQLKGYFERIKTQADRIVTITRGYLDFARADSGEKTAVEPVTLVEESVSFFVLTGHGKHMVIVRDYEPNIPPVMVEKGKIAQALLNLLVNAAHATEGQEERILKVGIHQDEPGRSVTISIWDNGCGIPPQHLEKIFGAYYSTKPQGKGTGLGLPIVKEIIEEGHGGKVTVESVVGEGTIFRILLPVQESAYAVQGLAALDEAGSD
jgi:PAS domain S-box-containing protein